MSQWTHQSSTIPAVYAARPQRRTWLNWLLLAATLITTTMAGAVYQGVNPLMQPWQLSAGLPYALGIMSILGLHELGHYFMARWHGMDVTLPYFIPVPFALGTFGAFIQMRSPAHDRRALFDVAVAGPLAGLAIAVPALLIGLQQSTILPAHAVSLPSSGVGGTIGSSILFAIISKAALGDALQPGYVLQLGPLAFAGWLGLLVTALNLLPIGQLDGGHITRAMFGHRVGGAISQMAMWTLFLLALFVWPALLMWAVIVFFIAGRPMPPLNDLTPLTPDRRALGVLAFAILLMILLPMPAGLWQAMLGRA